MNYSNLKISIEQAQNILFELFNIKGIASELPGEVDFNFRIKIEGEEGYILKISRPNEDENYLDFQQNLLQYVEDNGPNLIAPKVIKDKNNNPISEITDDFGKQRKVRLLSWVSGRVWSSVNPQLNDLRFSLGEQCGLLTQSLQGFSHPEAQRNFEWDVAQSLWTKNHIHLFTGKEKEIITHYQNQFELTQASYSKLRKAVVHNDANDNNVIVSSELVNPTVKAAIDYGDAIHTQVINDVAIACAYAIMNHNDTLEAALPIVKGYHSTFKLEEEELAHLYNAIAMRLLISVTKSAMNKIAEPDNTYLLISEKPAWEVLEKWRDISADYAEYSFREACGFSAHSNDKQFLDWANKNTFQLSVVFPTMQSNEVYQLDLSVASKW
ncbi:MAG: peptidase M23, partial [Kordia sp.]